MVRIEPVDGPLEPARLAWVADLYGEVDPKYRRADYLEHLFVRGPAGPALHAFAVAEDVPVGHAAIVPGPARRGADELRAGKLEALVVAESHRGGPVARTLLDRLYERADEQGFELIHAYVSPPVGRVIRFTRLDGVGPPSLVSLRWERSAPAARRAVAVLQGSVRAIVGVAVRGRRATLRRLTVDDRDLLATPSVPPDAWAMVADGALDWYAESPFVRVLELDGAQLLVQLPGSPREPLRVAGASTLGTREALAALATAARVAREAGATSVRLQVTQAEPQLRRAARLLGFVQRRDLTTLWVRARDPSLARSEAVVPTPMLYLGF